MLVFQPIQHALARKADPLVQCHPDPFFEQGPTLPEKLRPQHWDRSTQPFFMRTDPLKQSRDREQSMIVIPATYDLNTKRQASVACPIGRVTTGRPATAKLEAR